MWVKREKYESLVKLEGQLESKKERIAHLEKEIDYWREKFEEAQRRTDRIHDKTLVSGGIGPVSDLGVQEAVTQTSLYQQMIKDMEKQNAEMFSESIGEEEVVEVDSSLLSAVIDGMKD
jgi:hypothetical protein